MRFSKTTVVVVLIVVVLVACALIYADHSGPSPRGAHRVMLGAAEETKVRPRGGPVLLRPAGKGPHVHVAELDASGAGISTEDMGHRHAVRGRTDVGLERQGVIVPADHEHGIAKFIVDTS